MTIHWIDICGTQLQPCWMLRNRVLGAYPVEATRIDHHGACSIASLRSQADFSLFSRPCLISVCFIRNYCWACIGSMQAIQFACALPCNRHRLWGQCRQGFQHHASVGLASLRVPSHTQCREGGAGVLEEPCCQSCTACSGHIARGNR